MELPTKSRYLLKGDIPGSIGRVWSVDGVTQFNEDFSRAQIEVGHVEAQPSIMAWAMRHEEGHRDTVQDFHENAEPSEIKAIWDAADRWDMEIEAWLRGLDLTWTEIDEITAHFILDCLNSYRRALKKDDEAWSQLVELLGAYYEGDVQDLRDYVPLEPDPGEKAPSCGIPMPPSEDDEPDEDSDDESEPAPSEDEDEEEPEPDDEPEDSDEGEEDEEPPLSENQGDFDDEPEDDEPSDEDEPEEESDDDEESEEENEEEPGDEQDDDASEGDVRGDVDGTIPNTIDSRWFDQAVMDDLNDGDSLEVVAARHELDPASAPALVKAIAGGPSIPF